ncbi:MAG: hypothetical protein WD009_02810 [Phycisphaeraceae bacterium]
MNDSPATNPAHPATAPATAPVPMTAAPTRHVLALGLAAARANALPAILLWLIGSAIVASYYLWPAALPYFERITAWRNALGFIYPMISTAVFAGLIPYLMQALQRGDAPKRWSPVYLGYLLAFWAIKGVEIDLLYGFQAWLFGSGRDLATLTSKTAFDQFIYVALWGGPTLVLGLLVAQTGFSISRMRQHLRRGWYLRLVLPVVIPNWLVWIPAVMLIYMLPTVLQLPMQNVVLCLWVLMVMFMTGQQDNDIDPPATPASPPRS